MSFARFLTGLLGHGRTAALAGGAAVALILLSAVVLPASYRGRASFVANTSGGLKLPSSIGNLGSLAGAASQLGALGGGSEPSESPTFYVQLLQSRELLTRLAESRFPDFRTSAPADSARLLKLLDLRPREPRRRMEKAIQRLEDQLTASADIKTNLVTLDVDMPDAALAAAVVNRALELVNRFNVEQRRTRAGARRSFLEGRVEQAQAELATAENQHRLFLERNRVHSSPMLAAEKERLQRQLMMSTELYTSLRREYETARMNEVNDAPVITVVDTAVVPARPRWPRPAPLVVIALGAGGLVGFLAAATATLLTDWARRNPVEVADMRAAARRLGLRRRGGRPESVPVPSPARDLSPRG